MRVTHISIIHRPFDTRIFHKECRAMVQDGYEVHLVVGGSPAAQIDGVHLHAVAGDPSRPPLRRQWKRQLRATWWAFRLRPSIFHLHDPHLIPLGVLLKLTGARVVYDVHEDYPAHGLTKLVGHPLRGRLKAAMWSALEWLAGVMLDRFVCASPDLARKFPAARTTVVSNLPLREAFPPAESDRAPEPYAQRPNTVVYTGNITPVRGFWELVRAVELLPDELECRLRLIGYFHPARLVDAVRARDAWRSIDAMPWLPHPVLLRELLRVRVGLVLLHPLPNHGDPMRNNKLFEYMAAGLPVIVSDIPNWRAMVRDVGCGLVVDPRDPAAIAAAIQHLLEHPGDAEAMGRRGQAAVQARFNWDGDAARLLALYRGLGPARPRLAAGVPADQPSSS